MGIKIIMIKIILLLSISFSQIQYSGYLNSETKISNKTKEVLDLPYRLSEINFSYTFAMLDLVSKIDFEFRNKIMKGQFSIKELYFGLYPAFGEIRFGKQINTWGYTDGNNPTDNLNPYDLNYIFLSGMDRKIATISFVIDTYISDHKLGIVIIPKHKPNRLPIEGTDFAINYNDRYVENKNQTQWGLKFESILGELDYMLTYFNGYDFLPSYSGSTQVITDNGIESINKFEYRKTQVFGLSTVSFLKNFTFRNELAYFYTKTVLNLDNPANYNAQYIQYVFQLEYLFQSKFIINSQLIGNKSLKSNGIVMNDDNSLGGVDLNNSNMNLGTPFASFSEKMLLLALQRPIINNILDASLVYIVDLNQNGYMLGINIEYNPIKNWIISLDNQNFVSNDISSSSIFNSLEDFSNVSISVKFSF